MKLELKNESRHVFFRIFEFLKIGQNIPKKRQNLAQEGIHFRVHLPTRYKNLRYNVKFHPIILVFKFEAASFERAEQSRDFENI